jgi:hypothetical protein
MPCKPTALWIIAAIILSLSVPACLTAAAAHEALADGEPGDEDGTERRGRLPPADEPEEAQETQMAPTILGATRRPDTFDEIDALPSAVHRPRAAGEGGIVVCEAGCDGPRGKVVYRR